MPLALTGMLQQLFNAADVAVVGRFVGKEAMAAVGSNAPITGLLINLFIGVSIGANVVISRFTGQRNFAKVRQAAHTAVVLAVVCGLIIATVGQVIAAPMVHLLGVPETIAPLSIKYLRIYFGGMPVIMLYNFQSAIFKSQGDTRTPLICLAISGVVNVGLNVFFVVACGMDVDGVALATVLSNLLSSALLFRFLLRTDKPVRITVKDLRIDGEILKMILRIGIPSGLHGIAFSVSNLAVQSAVNSLGADVIAASSASFNIEIFCFFILNSFGQALVTFIGQNHGAGNRERCDRIVRQTAVLNIITTMTAALLILVFARHLLGLFNKDPSVIEYGYTRLAMMMPFEFGNATMETFSGALKGYGRAIVPALATFGGVCTTRIIWVYTVFAQKPSLRRLMAVYPVSWAIACVVLLVAYLVIRKRVWAEHLRRTAEQTD
ncbi:MAG: MATE family efflux transporter [Mogibacterium sp.]|nr:MATE family efflux transporter [Mogibacterium sp.]